jgi:hypothetical protein
MVNWAFMVTIPLSPALLPVLLGCLLASACAPKAQPSEPIPQPDVPEALKMPAGQAPVLKVAAEGVQIYTCKAEEGAPDKLAWALKAPEATLFDAAHAKVGKHYAGPTWEVVDGSKFVGVLAAKAEAPEPSAIPWLLIKKKSAEGEGLLANVAFVQRVHTAKGMAPKDGCDAANAGREVRVDYTADYYFYAP